MKEIFSKKVKFALISGAMSTIILITSCRSADRAVSAMPWTSNDLSSIDKTIDDFEIPAWPLVYHNSEVTSILWPLITKDKAGVEIRPIFFQDQDFYSFLYPLSGFDTKKQRSWILNAYHIGDDYGVFPLANINKNKFSYMGPVYWSNFKNYHGCFGLYHRGQGVQYIGPVVWNNKMYGVLPIFFNGEKTNYLGPIYWSNEKHSLFHKVGVMPFFKVDYDTTNYRNYLIPFYFYRENIKDDEIHFLSLLGGYSQVNGEFSQYSWLNYYNKGCDNKNNSDFSETFLSPVYLSHNTKKSGWGSVLGIVYNHSYGEGEKSTNILWPIFNYSYKYQNGNVNNKIAGSESMRLFPLISYKDDGIGLIRFTENEEDFLGPFIYYSKKRVLLKTNHKNELVLDKNFVSQKRYSWEKDKIIGKYSELEFVENMSDLKSSYDIEINVKEYNSLPLLLDGKKSLVKSLSGENRHTIVELFRLVKSWKIDKFGNLIISSKDKDLFHQKSFIINLKCSVPKTEQQKEEICRRLIEDYTQVVTIKDITSLLYSSKSYDKLSEWKSFGGLLGYGSSDGVVEHNNILFSLLYGSEIKKDSKKWNILLFLMRGEKEGNRERISLLEYLYRYERSGNKYKRTFFPGFSYYENPDKNSKRFSFLWKIFNLESQNDKFNGHILFIPFGS